jgi:guanidinopropionase
MSKPPRFTPTAGAPRYMDVATLLRTPLIDAPEELDIALIGVPYDGAVTNRPGARHGPREIRNASSMIRAIHPVTRVNPFELQRVGDAGDVPFTRVYDVEAAHQDITRYFERFQQAGTKTLAVGGDHSVTLPILRALAKNGPIGLVQLDAHTDTWGEWMGSKFNHGAPFRRAVEEGLIDPRRTVQIGIRGAQQTTEGWDFSREHGMRVIPIEEVNALGVEAVLAEAQRVVGEWPTYVTFDIDCLDPVYAPGTGTPEIGGLTTIQAQALVRGLGGLDLIGADVVEVAPPFDVGGLTALAGATFLYELLCVLVAGGD